MRAPRKCWSTPSTHRRADVGRADDGLRRGLPQLVELRWQAIDQGIAAEDNDPGGVALGHLGHGAARPAHQLLAGGVEHGGRRVEQEDDAQAISGQ